MDSRNNGTDEPICRAGNRDSDIENRLMDNSWGRRGWDKLRQWKYEIYTLPYVK